MVDAVKGFAHLDVELTPEERNLFAVAYKTVISQRRASWRLLLDLEEKEHAAGSHERLSVLQDVRFQLEGEMSNVAKEVLGIVEKHLIPSSTSDESLIFFQKMYVFSVSFRFRDERFETNVEICSRGDYYRYMSETALGPQRKDAAQNALMAYKAAYDAAIMHLHPTHPLRLGLALNFSVFYYEILGAGERACKLAKQAFDDAMAELQQLGEHPFQESTSILQLIRDNLTVWSSGDARTSHFVFFV
jgi:14-3-3 protein epsilon